MTVSTTQVRVPYTGDGTSVIFPIPFPFYLATDLLVLLAGAPISSGYSISGGGGSTGTLAMSSAPGAGINLQVVLNAPLTQIVNLVDGTAFPSATLDQVSDRAIQVSQRLHDQISRSIRAPDGDSAPLMLLPSAAVRASQALMLDSNGNITTGVPNTQVITTDLLAPFLNLQKTSAESASGVTVVNPGFAPNNVKRYGAVGDGVTDDTAALQAALNYAGFAGLTGLFFPQGNYIASSNIAIPGINITLYGEGVWASQITSKVTGSPADSLFTWTANAGGTSGQFLQVQGLRFNGNGLTGASGNGNCFSLIGDLSVTFANFVTFRDCEFASFMGSGKSAGGTSIPAAAIYCYFGDVVKVENTIFESCQQGVVLDGTAAASTQKVAISACTFDDLIVYGVQALFVDELLIDSQTIFNNIQTCAVYINNVTSSVTILTCRFKLTTAGNAIQANQPVNVDQINIIGCYFYTEFQSTVFPAVSIGTNCQGVLVQGCVFFFDNTTINGIGIQIANPSGDIGGAMTIQACRFLIGGDGTVTSCIEATNAINAINSLQIVGCYFGQGAAPGAAQSISDVILLTGAGGTTNPLIMGCTFSMLSPGSITRCINLGSGVTGAVVVNNTYLGNITTQLADGGTRTTRLEQGNFSISSVGFYGATPVLTRPVVSGSKGGNAALASLLTQLALQGIIADSSS